MSIVGQLGDQTGWAAILSAVQSWIRQSADVADGKVFESRQGGPQPTFPYYVYTINDTNRVGRDWRKLVDRVEEEGDQEGGYPGAELIRKYQGHRVATLVVECFSDGIGAMNPVALLGDVIDGLDLHVDDLDRAGAGIGDISAVTYGGGTRNGSLQPRASVSVTLHLGAEVQDYISYIESVEATIVPTLPTGNDDEIAITVNAPTET